MSKGTRYISPLSITHLNVERADSFTNKSTRKMVLSCVIWCGVNLAESLTNKGHQKDVAIKWHLTESRVSGFFKCQRAQVRCHH